MSHIAQMTRASVVLMAVVCLLLGISALSRADAKNSDLINMLSSENRGWRYSAAQLLGERRVAEAVEPLIDRLKVEKDYSVRIVVAQALYKIGDPRAIAALKKVARTDRNRTVRHMAAAIAAEMEKIAYTP
ncbi:MAG: HEAT repeat domain-containing protein [bacterium]